MKNTLLYASTFVCLAQLSSAQSNNANSGAPTNPSSISSIKNNQMTTETLTNPTVKSAIDALQKGDKAAWLALFAPNAQLFDDGSPRNFQRFSNDAIGHERFTSIDKVENNGLDVYGHFHSDQWGDFKVYFKFQVNDEGKVSRLDIGQANY
ncbi:MAG: hypothetical protein R2830_16630 [Saprospiraceae bacterium]